MPVPGGVIIRDANKKIVGAMGVSGDTSDNDELAAVEAIKKAGLVKTLSGKGPFTVLAPTNAAFAKVPKATLNALAANLEVYRDVWQTMTQEQRQAFADAMDAIKSVAPELFAASIASFRSLSISAVAKPPW